MKYRGGKPTFNVEQFQRVHELFSMGCSPTVIAVEVGIPRGTVYRIKDEPAKMAAVLEAWRAS